MRALKIIGILVVLLLVAAVILKQTGVIGQGKSLKVDVEKVALNSIIETVTASGKLYPQVEVKLNSEVSGDIINLFVNDGDSVIEGQLLLEIDPDIIQSNVNQARAAVDQAKANHASAKARLIQSEANLVQASKSFSRQQKLFKDKVISDADFEQAQATYDGAQAEVEVAKESSKGAYFSVKSAEASLRQMQDNLRQTSIRAPMSGIVTTVNVEKGETVLGTIQMAGTEILRIADLNNMEVRVDVSESDVLRIEVGDTTFIEVDAYQDRTFVGVVHEVASSANQESMLSSEQATNFKVKVRLLKDSYRDLLPTADASTDGRLRYPLFPGMSATAEIKTNEIKRAVTVPIQAVTGREDTAATLGGSRLKEVVYVIEGDYARERDVKTGIQDDDNIQILDGVEEGALIVSGPYSAVSRDLSDSLEVSYDRKDKESNTEGEKAAEK